MVTVLADESTDIAINKQLVLYVQISDLENMLVSTEFVTNVKLREGTGVAIADEIYTQFASHGVPPNKIMGRIRRGKCHDWQGKRGYRNDVEKKPIFD